jgi:MFS transporter, DHA1 family, staphyloferrin A biosynthesis exporter
VALNNLAGNSMRVIGPAIGGALIGGVGTQGTFQLQAACLVVAAILTWRLAPSHPELSGRQGVLSSMVSGMAYVWRDRRMLVIVAMAVLPSVLVYPYVTFLPVFAEDVLHSGASGYGFLAAAVGLGSLLGGAIVASTSGNLRMGQRMLWACLLYCVSVAGFTFMGNLWLAVGALAVAGIFHSVYSALNGAMLQLKADPAYRSRVVSLQTMTGGLTPFAGLAMGAMIDRWGAPHVVLAWMTAAAALTAVIIATSREMRRN